MKKSAVLYIARLIMQRILGVILFLLGSSFIFDIRTIVYFFVYILISVICGIIMYKVNFETISQRGKINTNSPVWDKILLTIYWISAYFIIYLFAGLELKTNSTIDLSYCMGLILYIISTIITLKAMMVNTYLESTSRIQTDRNQEVIHDGIYSIVRHPTYLAILIWCISISLIFQTKFVMITALFIALIIVIRTYLEDNMLIKELKGYREYTKKTKYRLIPFIW